MNADAQLDALLERWEEAWESGQALSVEELCRTCPEQVEALRQRTRALQAMAFVLNLDAEQAAERPPELADYEILGRLGQGGMGIVYQARDRALDRIVAIKMLQSCTWAGQPELHRFQREAQALARLSHENIVPIHQAQLHAGRPYFVMPCIKGGRLTDHLPRFHKNVPASITLMAKVARAVHFAHENGVLHRDLKPANILLDEGDCPKISDFGIAKLMEDPAVDEATPINAMETQPELPASASITPPFAVPKGILTVTGFHPGTPAYMAPEQFDPQYGKVSRATDVWALGVILYELLTGQRPFPGRSRETCRIQVCNEPPTAPRNLGPGMAHGLERIVLRCLEQKPERRFQTAREVADALTRWRQSSRRYRILQRLTVVALLAAAIAILLFTFCWPETPETRHAARTEALRERLHGGAPLTLLPQKGEPLSYLSRLGNAQASVDDEGLFVVESTRPDLIELLPNPGVAAFRFSAEIREERSGFDGYVGLYYAHQTIPSATGDVHLFGSLQFADIPPTVAQVQHQDGSFQSVVHHEHYCMYPPMAWIGDWKTYSASVRRYPMPPTGSRPWRKLTVEVTPQLVKCAFDGLGPGVALDEFDQLKTLQKWAQQLPERVPALGGRPVKLSTPHGGIGLFIRGCKASFRNVRLETIHGP